MHFEPDAIYHIYNRSNEQVFFNKDNYIFFLRKIREHIFPICEILAWVLMPNHYHFLIRANEKACISNFEKHRPNLQLLSKNFVTEINGYTQAINKQENRRGKLFSHDTKAKNLNEIIFDEALRNSNYLGPKIDYATTCFIYIHQNPILAGLVSKLENWEFSSYLDFARSRKGKLVNKELAKEIIDLDFDNFQQQISFLTDEEKLKRIF